MIVRLLLFSLVVAGFAVVVRAIFRATRHLETQEIEAALLMRDAPWPTTSVLVPSD